MLRKQGNPDGGNASALSHTWLIKKMSLFAPKLWKDHCGRKLLQPPKNELLLKYVRTAKLDTCYQGLLHFNQCAATEVCSGLMLKTDTKARRQLLWVHIQKICILHEKMVLWQGQKTTQPYNSADTNPSATTSCASSAWIRQTLFAFVLFLFTVLIRQLPASLGKIDI